MKHPVRLGVFNRLWLFYYDRPQGAQKSKQPGIEIHLNTAYVWRFRSFDYNSAALSFAQESN